MCIDLLVFNMSCTGFHVYTSWFTSDHSNVMFTLKLKKKNHTIGLGGVFQQLRKGEKELYVALHEIFTHIKKSASHMEESVQHIDR